MKLTLELPPDAAKCELLEVDVDAATTIRDIKMLIANYLDISCYRLFKVYNGNKLLGNRCLVKGLFHLSVKLPSAEVTLTFVDPFTELKMSIRMGNKCPMAAALSNWFPLFDEPMELYVRETRCNVMATPNDINWSKAAEKIVTICSHRGHLL